MTILKISPMSSIIAVWTIHIKGFWMLIKKLLPLILILLAAPCENKIGYINEKLEV